MSNPKKIWCTNCHKEFVFFGPEQKCPHCGEKYTSIRFQNYKKIKHNANQNI
jgi:Zn finger protein HypA/HybF involved in hydrogenase expression